MKLLLIIFFIFSAILYSENSEDYINVLYKNVLPSIVGVDVKPPDDFDQKNILKKGVYYGTGFVIAKNLVLTTRRVMQNELQAHCICYDNKIIVGKVVAYDENSPLTLLYIERSDLPVLPLYTKYKVGEIAFTFGNTYASIAKVAQTSISQGTISGIYDFTRWGITLPNVVETDCAVNPGIYGGPIVNLEGRVIATIFSGYSDSRVQGLGISVEAIQKFLDAYEKKETSVPDELSFLQVTPVYLGIEVIPRKRVTIVGIEVDSPAEDGLMVGDKILKVNDYEITSVKTLKQVVQTYFPGQTIFVTLKRKQMVMVVPITLVARFMR